MRCPTSAGAARARGAARWALILSLLFVSAAASCGDGERDEILVFAAASLTDALTELGDRFALEEGTQVRLNLGGSASLAQQILRGAPADAFIAAGPWPMDTLGKRGVLVEGTRADLLTNRLVIAGTAAAAETLDISVPEDLAGADVRIAIADPDLAPAGRYARQALTDLGLWERLEPRLVFASNVRVALTYLETRNVDVSIVYLTDLRASESLTAIVTFPPETHSPIAYPAAALKRSPVPERAAEFISFLRSEAARQTFLDHGFLPPGES